MEELQVSAGFRPAADLIFRRFESEAVLIRRRDGVADLTNYIILENEVSIRMWELLSRGVAVAEAADKLAEEFEVECETAQSDIRYFCDILVSAGFLVRGDD